MNTAEAVAYVMSHAGHAPAGLTSIMAADFGQTTEEPDVDAAEIIWRAEDIDRRLALAQALRENGDITVTQAGADWFDHEMGPGRDLLAQIIDLAGKVDGGEPPAPQVGCVHGTYSGHGQARDAYAGLTEEQVQWGPHHNIPLRAPVNGRVERYAIGTPLVDARMQFAHSPLYVENLFALSEGVVCAIPEQVMYVAVFWPNAPLVIDGQRIGHLHYGHVHENIRVGTVAQGDEFAWAWDTGIRFEPGVPKARATHTHCCAGAGTTLSPNGDLPGVLAVKAQGWAATDIGTVPGPTDYMGGRYTAGRLTTDFTKAGKPIPPMPS